MLNKPCQRCSRNEAVKTERFCLGCREIVLKEMEESGYLEPLPPENPRPEAAKEDTAETKFGPDEWTEGERFEQFVERA